MIIYKDKISGDEMLTDIYNIVPLFDGAIYRVKGKLTTETTDIDDSAIGGNASAEGGGDEGGDASSVSGVNIVIANRLVQTSMNKKSYMAYIKEYMKTIKDKLQEDSPDELDSFQKGCSAFVKDMMKDFKEWEFFNGESMNAEGMCALLKWETLEGDSEEAPYMYFFKHGLDAEKV